MQQIKAGRWFVKMGFKKAQFEQGKFYYQTFKNGHSVSFKLTIREGHLTYFKETEQGALFVFEVSERDDSFNAYSPIWLFGFWSLKLKFKEKPMPWAKYLQEGFKLQKLYVDMINSNIQQR